MKENDSTTSSPGPAQARPDGGTAQPQAPMRPGSKAARLARECFSCMVHALIISLLIINFIGRVSVVQGSSMTPSLESRDRILVNLMAYRFHKPARGEVIVFQCPASPEKAYIKRIIGLPGESVEIRKGRVFIDGRQLREPYLRNIQAQENMNKIKIPAHHVYVMGDNRANSEDSRCWGPLDCRLIKGKAQFVFWPPASVNTI